ncbi:MAG: hypothetical protein ABI724_12515 [Betaproteobacteria bacterium]
MTTLRFGLYPQSDFRQTDGRCDDCPTIRQALWYFEHETIAVPKPGIPVASFACGVRVADDLRGWLAARAPSSPPEYPPLVWVGAPDVVEGARLSPDATSVECAGGRLGLSLTPKLPLNRSYFDASSARYFHERTVKIRGSIHGNAIVARTLWPEDFRLDAALPTQPLDATVPTTLALRALMRSEPAGGARSPFAAGVLWERDAGRNDVAPGRAVLGIMVNGAQGDDDEAHAGHFALVTGTTDESGAIGDWLTNNFYSLDTESEKGILAAPVPLDNYLADLNSGQGWYRPSHMIVAVLRDARAPALVQAALNRVYNQFWRHQLVYRHATMNCACISVDVLRLLGWEISRRAPAGRLLAALAFPWFAIKERSVAKASSAFDYLYEEQTRLMPAAAFEEIGASLLALGSKPTGTSEPAGELARMISEDLEAILFVRLPQFPSSRVFGDAPAVSPGEYHSRLPPVPQVVPVPERPFPAALRDADLLPAGRPPSAYAAAIWGTLLIVGIPMFLYRQWRRWRVRDRSAN